MVWELQGRGEMQINITHLQIESSQLLSGCVVAEVGHQVVRLKGAFSSSLRLQVNVFALGQRTKPMTVAEHEPWRRRTTRVQHYSIRRIHLIMIHIKNYFNLTGCSIIDNLVNIPNFKRNFRSEFILELWRCAGWSPKSDANQTYICKLIISCVCVISRL